MIIQDKLREIPIRVTDLKSYRLTDVINVKRTIWLKYLLFYWLICFIILDLAMAKYVDAVCPEKASVRIDTTAIHHQDRFLRLDLQG